MLADALCEEQNCQRVIVEVEVDIGNHIAESVIFCYRIKFHLPFNNINP